MVSESLHDGEGLTWEKLRSQGCRTSHLIDGEDATSDALHIDKVTTSSQVNMSSSTVIANTSGSSTRIVRNTRREKITEQIEGCPTDIEESDHTQLEDEEETDDDDVGTVHIKEVAAPSIDSPQRAESSDGGDGKDEFWLGSRLSAQLTSLLREAKQRRHRPIRPIPTDLFFFQVCTDSSPM